MRIAVSATGHQALAAGLEVAGDGGNAVDAALAAAFVALATEPGMVSLAGGCYAAVWPADGEPVVVDGNVEMPGRGADPARFGQGVREVVTSYGGGVTMYAGPGSVATPGIVPALGLVHERYARLDWGRLIRPAQRAVTDGYPMSRAAARYLAIVADTLFAPDPEAYALLTSDGGLLGGGERTTNRALADVLEQLMADGPALFTAGAVGRALVEQMTADGGLITSQDLAEYRPVERPAYRFDVGDWDVAVNPPPAVGGPMLAVMLGELARRGDQWTWSDAIEVQRAVLGYRLDVHDRSWDLEADGQALLARVRAEGLAGLRGSSSTAHISAVDEDGTACAITMSSGYGAGSVIPGAGILLNNCLGEAELNAHGLHAVAPGTRLASNMAPTTARALDGRTLAIGSPGADRITTALLLVLGQGMLHGVDIQHAISRPRVHVRLGDEGFVAEHEAEPALAEAVAASGLTGHEYPEPNMYFGGVGAALLTADGLLEAAGDQRREAAVGAST